MTLGVLLGVVGCVLPFMVELHLLGKRGGDATVNDYIIGVRLIAAIYWTALIVWLVLR